MSDSLNAPIRAWLEETQQAITRETREHGELALRLRRVELRLAELRARREILEIDLVLTTVTTAPSAAGGT